MRRLWSFFKYNNAVPIIISLALLSFGTTLAASPEIRSDVADGVLSTEKKTLTIDNTYLVGKDLSAYTPRVIIGSVVEDEFFYYVSFSLQTIDLKDSVWQDVTKSETMKVGKDALSGKDLGLYVTRELKQRIDSELSVLRETQIIERRQVSQKTVATVYGGLIGKFLDDTTETIPGYTPVVVEVAPMSQSSSPETPSSQNQGSAPSVSQATGTVGTAGVFTMQMLGNNPAQLDRFAGYVDLGVVVTHSSGIDFGHKIFLDGTEVYSVSIDTTKSGTYSIRYVANDSAGGTVEATRTVIVGTGESSPPQETTAGSGASTTPPQDTSVSEEASSTPPL